MRLDSKQSIGGQSLLQIRAFFQKANAFQWWGLKEVQTAFSLNEQDAQALIRALRQAGYIQRADRRDGEFWTTTQLGQSLSCAKAGKSIKRSTADQALTQFLWRVARVNGTGYFLGKVTHVFVFGSYLDVSQDRLGDLDLAVQVEAKEHNLEALRRKNAERVEWCLDLGYRINGFLAREVWWRTEVFRFLKDGRRVISLHDYQVEREFIDKVAHRRLSNKEIKELAHKAEGMKPVTKTNEFQDSENSLF